MKKQILLAAAVLFSAGMIFITGCKKDDTAGPAITLNGSSTEMSILNVTWADPGATAEDDEDGPVDVTVSGTVNKDLAGNYTITYTATDAAGNESSEERTVTVYNEAAYLAGTYATKDSVYNPVAGGNSSYTETITASSTVNNRIWVTKFGNYVNGAVYMDRINATSFGILNQTVTCGSPANSRTFSNTFPTGGTITTTGATTLTLDYKETVATPPSTANAVSTWVKQ